MGVLPTIVSVRRILGLPLFLALVAGSPACQISSYDLVSVQDQGQSAAPPPSAPEIVIDTDSNLPDTHLNAQYQIQFQAHSKGGSLHWRLEKGSFPPGLKLEDDGLLHGQPQRTGEFQFTLSVWENNQRDEAVQKGFTLRVLSALMLNWKNYAQVKDNRIEGSAEVTNTTSDNIDLTFYVLAIPPNGRAVAIGYQHFVLYRGSRRELPFGESLPHDGYIVHVDAVGEVAAKKLIYREYLETPNRLQVTVGP
jgi:hypothetical protein